MCIYCDLKSNDPIERENAKHHVDNIIEACDQVSLDFKMIRGGSINPHTKDMELVTLREKHLIKLLLPDVL